MSQTHSKIRTGLYLGFCCVFIHLSSVSASNISFHIVSELDTGTETSRTFWLPVIDAMEDKLPEDNKFILRETANGLEMQLQEDSHSLYRKDIKLLWARGDNTILFYTTEEQYTILQNITSQNKGKYIALVLEDKIILLHRIEQIWPYRSMHIKKGICLPEAVKIINEYIDRTGDSISEVLPVMDRKVIRIDLRYFFIPFGVIAFVTLFLNRKKIFRIIKH